MSNKEKKPKLSNWFEKNLVWIAFLIFILGIWLIIDYLPMYLINKAKYLGINESTGSIGDTYGGTFGPAVALLGAILTFLAFYVQYRANRIQLLQLEETKQQYESEIEKRILDDKEANKRIRVERFEQKFYEMLKLHRDNVTELNIANKVLGRKCFVQMFKEFQFCYFIVSGQVAEWLINNKQEEYRSVEFVCNISYIIFFYGLGTNSNIILNDLFQNINKGLLEEVFNSLNEKQEIYLDEVSKSSNFDYINFQINIENLPALVYEVNYYPLDGHSSRLGHYFRHLFQLVKFVDQESELFDFKEKYKYVKLIRAQLSNHEQMLLYINSLSSFGKVWNEKKYIENYKLIKNVPLPQLNFVVNPIAKYINQIKKEADQGKYFFEWHRIKNTFHKEKSTE
jgi:hypothetical protein